MGDSLIDEGHLDFARDFILRARGRGVTVDLPVDLVIALASRSRRISQQPETLVVASAAVPAGWQALDIGPKTIERFRRGDCQVEDGLLERAPGVVRRARLRLRQRGDRPGNSPAGAGLSGGRRRFPGLAGEGRCGRTGNARLYWGRRFPGISRRPGVARGFRIDAVTDRSGEENVKDGKQRFLWSLEIGKCTRLPQKQGAFARNLLDKMTDNLNVNVVVCPPFPAIPAVAIKLAGSWICWGAQNMHWEAEGAYTGEVSAPMLQALGCRYVILGHSERRATLMRQASRSGRR